MAISEDLSIFLADHGVSVTAGAVSGMGIFNMPGEYVADGMAISTGYTVLAESSKFGGLGYGAAVTVASSSYTVLDNRLMDDGAFTLITLQKT